MQSKTSISHSARLTLKAHYCQFFCDIYVYVTKTDNNLQDFLTCQWDTIRDVIFLQGKIALTKFYAVIFTFLVLDLTQRPGKIWKEKMASKDPKTDCTLTLSDDNMAAMVR